MNRAPNRNDPPGPLSAAVWRRGALLGFQWLVVFVVASIGLFGLMGAVGWSGVGRALCALGAGPVIGLAAIAGWWMLRQPNLVPRELNGEPRGLESEE